MILESSSCRYFRLGLNIFVGQIVFIHRSGADQKGWDKFMTGGITLLGGDMFSCFSPNHVGVVAREIDGRIMILEASGHAGKVVLRDFSEYVNSNDVIVIRELVDEISPQINFTAEEIGQYVGLKFDDSCIIGLGVYQLLGFAFRFLGMRSWAKKIKKWPALKFGSGIHCSNFIFKVLEEKAGISKLDNNLAEINPENISPWDLWISSILKPCELSDVMIRDIPEEKHFVVDRKNEIKTLKQDQSRQANIDQIESFLKTIHNGGQISKCFR